MASMYMYIISRDGVLLLAVEMVIVARNVILSGWATVEPELNGRTARDARRQSRMLTFVIRE